MNKNTNTTENILLNSQDKDIEYTEPTKDVIHEWTLEFTKRVKRLSNSKKMNYTFPDALSNTTLHTKRDECLITAYKYLEKKPTRRK